MKSKKYFLQLPDNSLINHLKTPSLILRFADVKMVIMCESQNFTEALASIKRTDRSPNGYTYTGLLVALVTVACKQLLRGETPLWE
jgi:hypothetical protein